MRLSESHPAFRKVQQSVAKVEKLIDGNVGESGEESPMSAATVSMASPVHRISIFCDPWWILLEIEMADNRW